MARLVPPVPPDHKRSDAEAKLFRNFREELGPEWTVLHSLGLFTHAHKRYAEIDFVVVGPPGVLCIEVKGGQVARREGRWTITDRLGQSTSPREGPFEQVAGAEAALRAWLRSHHPEYVNAVLGFAVAMPDVVFTLEAPDVLQEVLFDVRHRAGGVVAWIARTVDYWVGRSDEMGRRTQLLAPDDVERLVAILRPDFDLHTPAGEVIRRAEEEQSQPTSEQLAVLHSDDRRLIVRGAAGTGKTLLAVELTRRAAARGDRVLLCCYNRLLAEHLRSTVTQKAATVTTIHAFAGAVIADAKRGGELPPAEPQDLFDVFIPRLAAEILRHTGPRFDVLIADEVQDYLTEPAADLLDAALQGGLREGRWAVFQDVDQDIFAGINPSVPSRLAASHPVVLDLTINTRNTAPVLIGLSSILGRDLGPAAVQDGPEIDLLWYDSRAERDDRLVEVVHRWHAEGLEPNDIVLLTRRSITTSGLEGGFGCPLHDLTRAEGPPGPDSLLLSTIHAFKGMEARGAILVDVDDLNDGEALRLWYVAGTRARLRLAVLMAAQVRTTFLSKARLAGIEFANRLS